MPQLDSAAVIPIADVRYPRDLGRKVRVAGLYVPRYPGRADAHQL